LKFIITEASAGWVPGLLDRLDATTERYRMEGSSANFFGGRTAGKLPMLPSEYFARNFFLGASFLHRNEALIRDRIGIDKIMWGGDFPHVEGSYPYSRQALQATFEELPVDDVRKMVSTNAAAVYGFDLDALQPIADRVGPTTAEVSEPLVEFPDSWCNAFARRPTYVE
jgi:predicted TIM-barrel fold metal-dependent hydrolase